MEIYFLRHGEAVDAPPGGSDAERELTEKGHRQSAKVAGWLTANKMGFDCIVCSGRKRAQQTAEPVAEALGMQIITDGRLSGGWLTVAALADLLEELGAPERVLLVGHEPDFSEMVELLTGGVIDMKKGALAAVRCDEVRAGEGIVALLLPPKWL
ncbi:MAG TPA: phosphohistidine phosphatase SixA [Armatimonadetes bacterium]|jgi:phosphohistidine phosphatase|nr:phosphohistidine phosphatase SixA [Armatimonadota bacterium]